MVSKKEEKKKQIYCKGKNFAFLQERQRVWVLNFFKNKINLKLPKCP